jgi:hypothetical protein
MQNDKQRWLGEIVALIPEESRYEVNAFLSSKLPRCHAKSRKTFLTWVRLTLARNEELSGFLFFVQERHLPLEIVSPAKEGFKYTVNGDVALIDVGSEERPAVWRVPASRLDWALGQYPVHVVELPPLEHPNLIRIRQLKRNYRQYRSPQERKLLLDSIQGLEDEIARDYPPVPRYELRKYVDGRDVPVHRLFMDAGELDQIEAVNGDLLNYGTATVRVEYTIAIKDGFGVRRGDRPVVETIDEVVPNLRVVNNPILQAKWEADFFQYKMTLQGDIDERPPRVYVNADWTAGANGKVVTLNARDKRLAKRDADTEAGEEKPEPEKTPEVGQQGLKDAEEFISGDVLGEVENVPQL